MASVAIAVTPEGDTGLSLGEQAPVRAIATLEDGTTLDCTAWAVWTSSNPAVVAFTPAAPGVMAGAQGGQSAISAACKSVSSAPLTISVGGGVRITGLEAYPHFLTGGVRGPLTATLVDASGTAVRDCTRDAVWSSSNGYGTFRDGNVLWVGTDREGRPATFVVSARCSGQTGQRQFLWRTFRVTGTVRASTGEPLAGARVYDDGNYIDLITDANGAFAADFVSQRIGLVVSLPGYETHQLPEGLAWNGSPAMQADVALPALPGIVLRASGKVCSTFRLTPEAEAVCAAAGASTAPSHAFKVPRNGTLEVRAYWNEPDGRLGTDTALFVNLDCNGAYAWSGALVHFTGGGFSHPARASCNYTLTFKQESFGRVLPYEFTVNVR